MLNYKKILLSPDPNERTPDIEADKTENYEDKIKGLKKEIKELTDNKNDNDEIESDVLDATKNALNSELEAALDNSDRKVVNKLVKTLNEVKEKNGGTLTGDTENLLNLLEKKQVDRILKDFDDMMSADRLKDLNSFTDDEIIILRNSINT